MAKIPDWINRNSGTAISPEYRAATVFEQTKAYHIRAFHPFVVDGLLQTPRYVKAALTSSHHPEVPDIVEARLTYRLERQQLLEGEDPPQFSVVLGRTAIEQARRIDAGQIGHLQEMEGRPNVDIRVIDFGEQPLDVVGGWGLTGGYRTMEGVDARMSTTEHALGMSIAEEARSEPGDFRQAGGLQQAERLQQHFDRLQQLATPLGAFLAQ